MLTTYLICIIVATVAVYLTTKIEDEVFRVGMGVVSVVFGLVTLVCAPWILKLFVVVLPLFFGNLVDVSG